MTQIITPEYIQSDNQSSSPSAPPLGYVRLYVKSDGDIYIKNDQNVETNFVGNVIFLDDFTDVTLTSPSTDEYLRYDSGTSKWTNQTLPTPNVVNIDDFSDVTITALSEGDVLVYEDGEFKNDKNQPALLVSSSFEVPDSGGGDLDYAFYLDGSSSGEVAMINSGYLSLWQTASSEEDLGVYLLTANVIIQNGGSSNQVTLGLYQISGGGSTLDSIIPLNVYSVDVDLDVYTTIYCPVLVTTGVQYSLGANKLNDGDYPFISYRITWEKLGHNLA